jgi:hypothetical protein
MQSAISESTVQINRAKKVNWGEFVTLFVVIVILVARARGTQLRVDWEDTFGIGVALSKGLGAIWEPTNYGVLSARIMQLAVTQFPLVYLPATILIFATTFWLANLAIVYIAIAHSTNKRLFASLTVIGLALLPTPVIGGQGVIQGSWWLQTFTLMVVLASFPKMEIRGKLGIFILVLTAITVASFPIGVCLASPIVLRLIGRRRSFTKWHASLLGAFILGATYQIVAFFRRTTIMNYLGEWAPNQKNERDAVYIWSETSADKLRNIPKLSIEELPKSMYISIKSIFSELLPEPFRSMIHGEQSWFLSLLTILLVLFSFCLIAIAFWTSENKKLKGFVNRLTVYLFPIFVFQFVTAGTLNVFQYANLFDMTLVVVISGMIVVYIENQKFTVGLLTMLITSLFVASSIQQFRDPARYGSGWAKGYKEAKIYCSNQVPDEVVVIVQGNSGLSHQSISPIGIRCKDLR